MKVLATTVALTAASGCATVVSGLMTAALSSSSGGVAKMKHQSARAQQLAEQRVSLARKKVAEMTQILVQNGQIDEVTGTLRPDTRPAFSAGWKNVRDESDTSLVQEEARSSSSTKEDTNFQTTMRTLAAAEQLPPFHGDSLTCTVTSLPNGGEGLKFPSGSDVYGGSPILQNVESYEHCMIECFKQQDSEGNSSCSGITYTFQGAGQGDCVMISDMQANYSTKEGGSGNDALQTGHSDFRTGPLTAACIAALTTPINKVDKLATFVHGAANLMDDGADPIETESELAEVIGKTQVAAIDALAESLR